MIKIGIMGGTFDPIHIGHLSIAQKCLEYKNLDRILFIPTGRPNFKQDQNVTESYHRLNMVQIAINSNDKFYVSDYEINKDGLSYSSETIKYLNDKFPATYYFIMGEDSLYTVKSWHQSDYFLNHVKILVCRRSHNEDRSLQKMIASFRDENIDIELMPFPFLEISSTDIRETFKRNKNPRYLLMESVYRYIIEEGLYCQKS